MREPSSERALRRIVADLAAASPEDAADVIGALAPAQADRVRALLAELLGAPASLAPVEAIGPTGPSLAGLSPWLASRFEATGEEIDLRMTPDALAALKTAVAQAQPDAELVEPPGPALRRSWLDRLTARRPGRAP